jgi:hypothetical protein
VYGLADAFVDPQPIQWIVEDVFPEDSIVMLFGKPSSKKSFSSLSMALCVAAGMEWAGHRVRQSKVLYMDFELFARRFNFRLRGFVKGYQLGKEIPFGYTTTLRFDLRKKESVEQLDEILGRHGPEVIFMDSLIDVMPGADENSTKDMGQVCENLLQIMAKRRCSFVVVHHSTKDGKEYRGHSSIEAAVRAMFRVEANRLTDIHFECKKLTDQPPEDFDAILHAQGDEDGETVFWLSGGGQPQSRGRQLSGVLKRIYDCVKAQPDSKATINEICGILKGSNKDAVKKAVQRLVSQKMLVPSKNAGREAIYEAVP